MTFNLSASSRSKLVGVHPDLVRVVDRAIEITRVDFKVIEGVRTVARQHQLVSSGASQTMDSRHITGHAVDLAAMEGSRIVWAPFSLYEDVAESMRVASIELGVDVMWGAAWHVTLKHGSSASALMDEYVALRRSQGRRPFMDGPHFQLSKSGYP